MALTETWLSANIDLHPLFGDILSDYQVFKCDRLVKKGGGALLLFKNYLVPRLIFCESVVDSYEILCCDFLVSCKTVRVILVYRTPSCSSAMTVQLLKVMGDLHSSDRICLIIGDFKFPNINWDRGSKPSAACASAKLFLVFCSNLDLLQYVHKPTHGSNVLDLVLCNEAKIVSKLHVDCPIGSSDHSSVNFQLNLSGHIPSYILKRDFKAADFQAIRNFLGNIDWIGSFASCSSVNDMYETFLTILQHSIAMFVPLIKANPVRPYLPQYLDSLFRKKSSAWFLARRTESPEDWATFEKLSKAFDKKLWKYNNSLERKVIESRNRTGFFKFLNSKLKCKSKIGALVSDNGSIVLTDVQKAEAFAVFFESVFVCDNSEPDFISPPRFPVMEDSIWFQADNIYNIIQGWPCSVSLTPDHIPFRFVKEIAYLLVKPLEFIFNQSMMRGQVPGRWKISYVTPIPKKASHSLPKNYRPVSITSFFCRLFEKNLKV